MNENDEIHLDEIFKTLAELRGLDLEKASLEQIKTLLKKLYRHGGIKQQLAKGRYVQRGILLDNDPVDFFPKQVSRLSYNPKGSAFGRANYEGAAVFYGCIASEIMQGYNCTAMELLPLHEEGIFQHRIVVSNWLLSENTEFVFLGGTHQRSLCVSGKQRHEQFMGFLSNHKAQAIALYAIDQFLCNEFSKEVAVESPWEYKISAVYTKLLEEMGESGLIYPSVKSSGAGLNLIIFRDKVDQGLITFHKAVYGTFYCRDKNYINEYTLNAVAKSRNLQWGEVYLRLDKGLKDYYTGRSESNPARNFRYVDLGGDQ